MNAATTSDLTSLSAQQLSQQIASRKLSPVDVVDAYLARIGAKEPKLQAFVDVYRDDARLAAEAVDKAIRSGHAVGPLHGVPIALKDLIDLEGRVTTGGSAVWRERRSPVTATLARRLIAAGMIVLGKTHTVEFGMAGSFEDAALLYSVMQGADRLDPRTQSAPPPMDPMAGMRRGVRGMRLARMPAAEREGCTQEMLAAYDAALDLLAGAGAEIVEI